MRTPTFRRRILFGVLALLCSARVLVSQQPAPVSLRIIVVRSAEEAQSVLERLKTGEDFAALAREKSQDSTAEDGGSMGQVDPSTLRRELREALEDLGPGQVTGPVRLSSGYAILKIDKDAAENITPATPRSPPSGPNLSLAGRGNVRYSANVGGAPEADAAFTALPNPRAGSGI